MTVFRSSRTVFLATCLLACFAVSLSGQEHNRNARMSGLANSAGALLSGVEAIGANPALVDKGKLGVSFALVPFSLNAGSDFFDYTTYDTYFTGVLKEGPKREPYYLLDNDKQDILRGFASDVGNFTVNGSYTLFAATVSTHVGAIGFNISDRISSNISVPREYVEFLLYGNTPGKTFDLSKTALISSWTRDYGLTLAKRIDINKFRNQSISFGATLKYIHGYGYFGVDRFDSHFTTDPDSFVVTGHADMHAVYAGTEWIAQKDIFQFQLFPEPVGTGIGMDLGIHAAFSGDFSAGVSLVDIGAVSWNRTTKEISVSEDFTINDIGTDNQTEEIKERLNGTEAEIESFTHSLPTAVIFATAYSARRVLGSARPLNLTFGVRHNFNNLPGLTNETRVGFGAEWEFLESLPLRAGIALGGETPVAYSLGIGLKMDVLTVNLATSNIESAFRSDISKASFAVSSRLDF